jgi:hypothetical protein
MQVFEMETFNGTLYVGNGASTGGYSVWKVSNTSTLPYGFTPVVTAGAGRGSAITSVVSMHEFENRLYVGSSGWGVFPNSELIRINPDDTWDVVVGNPRTVSGSSKAPISGLNDGYGNILNAHFWRMETHNGVLYVGTNDASWGLRNSEPWATLLAPEFGFDLFGSCDGQYWFTVTRDGFGDGRWNFGARTMVSTSGGMYLGTANHVEGTSVWLGNASPCGTEAGELLNSPSRRTASPSGSASTAAPPKPVGPPLAPPTRLLTDVRPCGTALTWDRTPGATRYRILRADYRTAGFGGALSPLLSGELSPELLKQATRAGSGDQRLWVAGQYTSIGTTTKRYFVDRTAKRGARYNYEVVAEGPGGQVSGPSNMATVPAPTTKATFGALNTAIRRLIATSDQKQSGSSARVRTKVLSLASAARASWQQAGPAASLPILAQLRNAVSAQSSPSSRAAATAAKSDVQDAIFQLERRANLDAACKG